MDNSSLNQNQNRRQALLSFFDTLNEKNNIDPEKFNKLLGEACGVGILIKLQKDKNGHTPKEIYDYFVERFGDKAYVIANFSETAFYILKDKFRHSHVNKGKEALARLKAIRNQIVQKKEQREAREKEIREINTFRDKLLIKYDKKTLSETDLLSAINFLEERQIITPAPPESEKIDFYWKYPITENGKRKWIEKKYVFRGQRNSIEHILFLDIKKFKAEIIRQIREKQILSKQNKPAYHDHSVVVGGSRKMAKLLLREIKGESHYEKKRNKKIRKQQKREKWQYFPDTKDYFSDDE